MTFYFLWLAVRQVTFETSSEANCDALRFGQRSELDRRPGSTELRNRVRYRLAGDAVFAWEGSQKCRLQGEGVTRDISVAGAFIYTRTCPPVGTAVELDIFLSPAPGNGGRTVRI